MKGYMHILFLVFVLISCQSRTQQNKGQKLIGGPCEGCEAIFEYGDKVLTAVDTLPGFEENNVQLKITGKVYHKDGKTPAPNVILYIYQTNKDGIYETKGNPVGWGKRHGHIRGWVKTSADGLYTFYTFRPGAYPNRNAPEHIHLTVKEPDKNEYYLDDYVFVDDPLLTDDERKRFKQRGGSGILKPKKKDGFYLAERDIILGLNVPNY